MDIAFSLNSSSWGMEAIIAHVLNSSWLHIQAALHGKWGLDDLTSASCSRLRAELRTQASELHVLVTILPCHSFTAWSWNGTVCYSTRRALREGCCYGCSLSPFPPLPQSPEAPARMNHSNLPEEQLPSFHCLCVYGSHSRKLLHFVSTGANSCLPSSSNHPLVIFLGLLVWVSCPTLGRCPRVPSKRLHLSIHHIMFACLFLSLLQARELWFSSQAFSTGFNTQQILQDGDCLNGFLPCHSSSKRGF